MREHFEIPDGEIYLNSGTFSRVPKTVLDKLFYYQSEYEKNPTMSLIHGWEKLWDVQKKVSAFFNIDPVDFYFRPNVTSAMNSFLLGVELPFGDITISDQEYGSIVNICKLRAQKENRKINIIKIPKNHEYKTKEEFAELMIKQIPKNTALLMLSHIMTGAGIKIPVDLISNFTNENNIIYAVDGAHGPGAMDLDFKKLSNIDFYGGNLHKWMMGPKGTGFGVVRKSIQEKVKPIEGSWTVFENLANYKKFGDDNRFTLMMLMSSCHNFSNFYALSDLIDFWNFLGKEDILYKLHDNRDYLEKMSKEILGLELISSELVDLKSPLLDLKLPSHIAETGYDFLFKLYQKHKITVALPIIENQFTLRLSAHIYSTQDEMKNAILKIKEELK